MDDVINADNGKILANYLTVLYREIIVKNRKSSTTHVSNLIVGVNVKIDQKNIIKLMYIINRVVLGVQLANHLNDILTDQHLFINEKLSFEQDKKNAKNFYQKQIGVQCNSIVNQYSHYFNTEQFNNMKHCYTQQAVATAPYYYTSVPTGRIHQLILAYLNQGVLHFDTNGVLDFTIQNLDKLQSDNSDELGYSNSDSNQLSDSYDPDEYTVSDIGDPFFISSDAYSNKVRDELSGHKISLSEANDKIDYHNYNSDSNAVIPLIVVGVVAVVILFMIIMLL